MKERREGCVFSCVKPVAEMPPPRFQDRQRRRRRDDLSDHRSGDKVTYGIFAMLQSITGASVVGARLENKEHTSELKTERTEEDQNTKLPCGRETARCAENSSLG